MRQIKSHQLNLARIWFNMWQQSVSKTVLFNSAKVQRSFLVVFTWNLSCDLTGWVEYKKKKAWQYSEFCCSSINKTVLVFHLKVEVLVFYFIFCF